MATTAVKERPILFSGEMVRAILDGRKTQTRRIVKLPSFMSDFGRSDTPGYDWAFRRSSDGCWEEYRHADFLSKFCRHGVPGDRLWVKETHRFASGLDDKSATEIEHMAISAGYRRSWAPTRYLADGAITNGLSLDDFGGSWGRKRVSIHMPRWASRITLEIADVRIERLQDISDDDARAEGVGPIMVDSGGSSPWGEWVELPDHIEPFFNLWESINGRASWTANPWVWALTFRRITR